MSILIISQPQDVHAAAVCWGLEQLGCTAVLWNWADFPRHERAALAISSHAEDAPVLHLGIHGQQLAAPFKVIWNRRRHLSRAMSDSHPDDVSIIENESNTFLKTTLGFLGTADSFWVNPQSAALHAENKPVQLLAARALGFAIPDTLIGNDFARVKAFFDKHDGKIIYKAFYPGQWRDHESGVVTKLRTSALSAANFEDEFGIRACPGIFQACIEKAYEIRVTVIGDTVLAAAIDSQRDGATVDWRSDLGEEIPLKKITLPTDIARRCVALCKNLGLVFGCIDLIVTKTGEYVFLEVNEAGQFLWKEGIDPSLLLLDSFCRLLASAVTSTSLDGLPTLHYADWKISESAAACEAFYLQSQE